MPLDTYDDLKASIATHLDRDDLTDQIPEFIALAEARHKRDIRLREMLTRDSLSVDSRYVSLPDGFLEAQTLRLLTNPVTPLSLISINEMTLRRRDGSGKPSYYAIHSQFEFDVDPDSSYSGEIVFYKSLAPLADDNQSNALLVRAPDAYLYGALSATAPFLMNDERLQIWNSLYRQAVDGLSQATNQGRYVGPLVSRPYGATP